MLAASAKARPSLQSIGGNFILHKLQQKSRRKHHACFHFLNHKTTQFAYADTGSQVHTKFLSPNVLLMRDTEGQNLFAVI